MSLTLPYSNLSGVVDDAKLEANFNAVANKFSGGINDADVQNSANINVTKLSASKYELVLSCSLVGVKLNETAANTFIVIGGIPYDTTADTYTISGIEHLTYTTAGVTAAVFTLLYGNHTDTFATIQAGITTGTASTQTRETGFTSSITTSSVRPKFFVLDVTTQGASFAATDSWAISIKLKKALRT